MLLLKSLLAFDKRCMYCPTADPPAYPGSSHPTAALPVEELRRGCEYLTKERANR
jgi:hypothetical protein